jgi:hypothetical protein
MFQEASEVLADRGEGKNVKLFRQRLLKVTTASWSQMTDGVSNYSED